MRQKTALLLIFLLHFHLRLFRRCIVSCYFSAVVFIFGPFSALAISFGDAAQCRRVGNVSSMQRDDDTNIAHRAVFIISIGRGKMANGKHGVNK